MIGRVQPILSKKLLPNNCCSGPEDVQPSILRVWHATKTPCGCRPWSMSMCVIKSFGSWQQWIRWCGGTEKSLPPAMKPIGYAASKPVIRRRVSTCCGQILFSLQRSESAGLVWWFQIIVLINGEPLFAPFKDCSAIRWRQSSLTPTLKNVLVFSHIV